MSVDGTLIEDKMRRFEGDCAHVYCTRIPKKSRAAIFLFAYLFLLQPSFPFTPMTVQRPNLALTHTKRITVQYVFTVLFNNVTFGTVL